MPLLQPGQESGSKARRAIRALLVALCGFVLLLVLLAGLGAGYIYMAREPVFVGEYAAVGPNAAWTIGWSRYGINLDVNLWSHRGSPRLYRLVGGAGPVRFFQVSGTAAPPADR
jgi:hypothetical protein